MTCYRSLGVMSNCHRGLFISCQKGAVCPAQYVHSIIVVGRGSSEFPTARRQLLGINVPSVRFRIVRIDAAEVGKTIVRIV